MLLCVDRYQKNPSLGGGCIAKLGGGWWTQNYPQLLRQVGENTFPVGEECNILSPFRKGSCIAELEGFKENAPGGSDIEKKSLPNGELLSAKLGGPAYRQAGVNSRAFQKRSTREKKTRTKKTEYSWSNLPKNYFSYKFFVCYPTTLTIIEVYFILFYFDWIAKKIRYIAYIGGYSSVCPT